MAIVTHNWTDKPARLDQLKDGEIVTTTYQGKVSSYLKLNGSIYSDKWTRLGSDISSEPHDQNTLGGFIYDTNGFSQGSLEFNSSDENIIITDPSGTQRVILGRLTTIAYGLQVNNSSGQSVFKLWGNEADLCGWQLNTTSISKIDGTHSVTLDSANEYLRIVNSNQERVLVGKVASGDYGVRIKDSSGNVLFQVSGSTTTIAGLDLNTAYIGTSTFATGLQGWRITSSGDAEFSNLLSRGTIQASTFSYDNITATAGSQIITKSASTLYEDMVIPTANGTITGVTINAGGSGYAAGSLEAGSGSNGSGFAATYGVDGSGVINSISISNAGSGYDAVISVQIDDPGGSGSGANLSFTYSSTTWSIKILKEPSGGATGFANNDICRIKAVASSGAIASTWFQIASISTSNDDYDSATCTWKSGSKNITYRKGTAVVDYGASGQGFIYSTAIASATDIAELRNAPYIAFGKHSATPWSSITSISRIGELNGSYGYSGSTYGAAFGEYASGKNNITIDSTNGLRIRNHTTTLAQWEIDGDIVLGNTSGSTADLKIYGGSSSNYVQMNAGNLQFRVGSSTFNFPFVQYIPETVLNFGTAFDFTDNGLVDIPTGYSYEVLFLPKAMKTNANYIGYFAESKTNSGFTPIMKSFSSGIGGVHTVTSSFSDATFVHRGSNITTSSVAYNNAVDSDDAYHTINIGGTSHFGGGVEVDTVQVYYTIANDHATKDGTCAVILRSGEKNNTSGTVWESASGYHEALQNTWVPANGSATGIVELSYLPSTGDYDDDYLVSLILGSVSGHGSGSESNFTGTITKIIYKDSGDYTEVTGVNQMAALIIAKQT